MEVESYSFGRIKIGGKEYTSDVIVGRNFLKTNWWRKEGHRVQLADIPDILEYEPEVVVFGTGANDRVSVDSEVVEKLRSMGCEVYAEPTARAVQIYNEMLKSGKKVLLAAHLTC